MIHTCDNSTSVEIARRPVAKRQGDGAAGEVLPSEGRGLAGCELVAIRHGDHEGIGPSRLSGDEGRERRERGEDVREAHDDVGIRGKECGWIG